MVLNDSELVVGQIVDRYEILRTVGRAGFAHVYEARATDTGHFVALKLLRDDRLNPKGRRVMLREAEALRQIVHPAVTRVLDMGETKGGQLWLALELLHGETVRQTLRRGALPPSYVLDLIATCAEGLQAAHERGVIHRDVKPDNIFVTESGQVKLLELGSARFADWALSTTGKTWGTVPYMAPEQICGREVTPRTDIYALGLVAYELLAGYHPFAENVNGESEPLNAHHWVAVHLHTMPAKLDQLPPYVWKRIEKAIRKNPIARYDSAEQFARELRKAKSYLGRRSRADGQPSTWKLAALGAAWAAPVVVGLIAWKGITMSAAAAPVPASGTPPAAVAAPERQKRAPERRRSLGQPTQSPGAPSRQELPSALPADQGPSPPLPTKAHGSAPTAPLSKSETHRDESHRDESHHEESHHEPGVAQGVRPASSQNLVSPKAAKGDDPDKSAEPIPGQGAGSKASDDTAPAKPAARKVWLQ